MYEYLLSHFLSYLSWVKRKSNGALTSIVIKDDKGMRKIPQAVGSQRKDKVGTLRASWRGVAEPGMKV